MRRKTVPTLSTTQNPKCDESHLVLDHFYAAIDPVHFVDLKFLKDLIPLTEIRTTTSGDETWSGVYVYASSGIYFELLERSKDRLKAGFGLGFSRLGTEAGVEKCLRSSFPDRDWIAKEILRDGKEPWFLSVYPKKQLEDERIWTWAMEYRGSARDKRHSRIGAETTPVRDFNGMEIVVPMDLFLRLPNDLHVWIPAQKKVEGMRYEAQIDRFMSDPFILGVTASKTEKLPRVTRVRGILKGGRSLAEFRNKTISLEIKGNRFDMVFSR